MPVVYRTGNAFSDTRAGTGSAELAQAIRVVARAQHRRVRGRLLTPAETRNALPAERRIVARVPDASGGGIASPLSEQAYGGQDYHLLVSSDGLLVLEYPAHTDYLDGDGNAVRVNHLDHTPEE